MKKRCIWNWYRKRKIEYLDERDKWFKYLDMVVLGIFIAIGVIGPIAILIALFLEAATKYQMPFQNAMRSAGIQFIVLLPFMSFWEYIVYTQIYNDMISNGVYYLNERGIQLEYYPNICKEIYWEEIEFIERRTILNDVREGRQASECEIFFICKKGCTEKEKKVILLYYYEDLTLKEISNILSVSESRISQLHTRALQKMKAKMGNYMGIFSR